MARENSEFGPSFRFDLYLVSSSSNIWIKAVKDKSAPLILYSKGFILLLQDSSAPAGLPDHRRIRGLQTDT